MSKLQVSPVEVVSSLKLGATSSWHKLGDRPWSGQVTNRNDETFEIEELASSWKCTTTGATAKTLEALLKKVLR